jgi:threonine/homoserine/homoserine lactone efflux protein
MIVCYLLLFLAGLSVLFWLGYQIWKYGGEMEAEE